MDYSGLANAGGGNNNQENKSKAGHPLNKFFPGLAGIPNISAGSNPRNASANSFGSASDSAQKQATNDPNGPPQLSAAQLHFQRLLAGKGAGASSTSASASSSKAASGTLKVQSKTSSSSMTDNMGNLTLPPPPKIPKLPSVSPEIPSPASSLEYSMGNHESDSSFTTTLSNERNLTYVIKSDVENEPEITPVTLYKSDPRVPNAALSGVRVGGNAEYICYVMKQTQVRVIHKASVQRALLKGHNKPVTDLQFCPLINSLLGTISHDGFAIIWELKLDQTIASGSKLLFRETLRLRPNPENSTEGSGPQYFTRIRWHPKFERLFALAHGDTVSFVELSGSLWNLHKENGEAGTLIANARVGIARSFGEEVTSMDFNNDGTKLVTGSGMKVKIWGVDYQNLNRDNHNAGIRQLHSFVGHSGGLVSHVFYGSHTILSFAKGNSEIRLWNIDDSYNTSGCQQLTLKHSSSVPANTYVVDVSWSNKCIVVGDAQDPVMLCIKLSPSYRDGFLKMSHVVQFSLAYPTYCIDIMDDTISEQDDDVFMMYCIQSKAIHQYRIKLDDYINESETKGASEANGNGNISLPLPASPSIPAPANGTTMGSPIALLPRPSVPSSNSSTSNVRRTVTAANTNTSEPSSETHSAPGLNTTEPASTGESSSSGQVDESPTNNINTVDVGTARVSTPVDRTTTSVPREQDTGTTSPLSVNVTVLQELLDAQLETIESQAKLRAEKDTERQQLLLRVLSKSLNEIPDSVETVMKDLSSDLSRDIINDSSFAKGIAAAISEPLKASVTAALRSGAAAGSHDEMKEVVRSQLDALSNEVSKKLQKPLVDTFKTTVEYALVPAFQAACTNMANQVGQSWLKTSTELQNEVDRIKQNQNEVHSRLNTIQGLLEKLVASNSSQGAIAGQPQSGSGGSDSQQHTSSPSPKEQVDYWISRGDYENAFLTALHAQNADLLTSTCKHASGLLSQSPLPLSQKVLLSLFHQISYDLTKEPVLKLEWLKNIGLALDKTDKEVGMHLPRVVNNVKQALNNNAALLQNPNHPAHSQYKLCVLVVNSL